MTWGPLPEGEGANPLIRRLRAIDAEIYGNFYAHSGTIGGDVTIEGNLIGNDMYSSNWNGSIPANLATKDSGASAGYYLDGSAGAVQFQNLYAEGGELGTLSIANDLTMTAGGNIFTAATSGEHINIGTDGAGVGWIDWFNGSTYRATIGAGSGTYGVLTFIAASGQNMTGVSATQTMFEIAAGDDTYGWGKGYIDLYVGLRNVSSVVQWLGPDGSASAPGISFASDPDTGIYWYGTNQIAISVGGTLEMLLGSSGFKVQNVYDSTDPTAANVFVDTDGGLKRSTSSIRYKTNVRDAGWLAMIPLRPVAFTSRMKSTHHFGLIAEEVADALPEAAIRGDDGRIEDYDTRAVIAVLVAKVNRLEKRLEEHGIDRTGS